MASVGAKLSRHPSRRRSIFSAGSSTSNRRIPSHRFPSTTWHGSRAADRRTSEETRFSVSERGRRQRLTSAIRATRKRRRKHGSRAADRRTSEETRFFPSPNKDDVNGSPARSSATRKRRRGHSRSAGFAARLFVRPPWAQPRQPGGNRLTVALVFLAVALQQHRFLIPVDERGHDRPHKDGVRQ